MPGPRAQRDEVVRVKQEDIARREDGAVGNPLRPPGSPGRAGDAAGCGHLALAAIFAAAAVVLTAFPCRPCPTQMPVDVDSFLLVGRKAVKMVGGRKVQGVIRMWTPTFGAGRQHGEAF